MSIGMWTATVVSGKMVWSRRGYLSGESQKGPGGVVKILGDGTPEFFLVVHTTAQTPHPESPYV